MPAKNLKTLKRIITFTKKIFQTLILIDFLVILKIKVIWKCAISPKLNNTLINKQYIKWNPGLQELQLNDWI